MKIGDLGMVLMSEVPRPLMGMFDSPTFKRMKEAIERVELIRKHLELELKR